MSGATLERGKLLNGRPIVVKRSAPGADLFQSLLGHRVSLEYRLWEAGVLDRLPSGVGSAVIGGWIDGDGATTLVMDDLGDEILGWDHAFGADDAHRLVTRVHEMHEAHTELPIATTPLEHVVGTFAPARIRSVAPGAPLLAVVERGWEAFGAFCPPGVRSAVTELVDYPAPLVCALAARPSTFCHGDVAAVNMAWRGDRLVLIDWGQAFVGPPTLDIARFLPSGLRIAAVDRDWLIDEYARVAGDRYDAVAMRLALLATLVWFGWSKSLDAAEHPDPTRRAVEVNGLAWWCARAADALELL